jgi:hypothetical protein
MGIGTGIDYFFACCFTDEQRERILDLIYENNIATFSVSPTTGERGVSTALTLNYNIESKDDEFTAASINQGVGDILDRVDAGAQSEPYGNKPVSLTFTLSMAYNRNSVPTNENKTATYNAWVPQWSGATPKTRSDFSGAEYAALNAELTKVVQPSTSSLSKSFTVTDGYPWFVVSIGTGVIRDGNGFAYDIGAWDDPTAYFWRKSITLTLNDGVTTSTVWLIRTRESHVLSAFTFIHSNS